MKPRDRKKYLEICREVVDGGLTAYAEDRAVVMGIAGAITYLLKLKHSLDAELEECVSKKAHAAHIAWVSSFREQIKAELKYLKDKVDYEEKQ